MLKIKQLIFILGFLLIAVANSFGQHLQVASTLGGVPTFLPVCAAVDTVAVEVRISGTDRRTRDQIVLSYAPYFGVEFVALLPALSSLGTTVSNAQPSQPQFTINDLGGTNPAVAIITFQVRATCSVLDTVALSANPNRFKDVWQVDYQLGGAPFSESFTSPQYRDAIAAPFFSIQELNAVPPVRKEDVITQQVEITNTSLQGYVNTLNYEILLGRDLSLRGLTLDGLPISITKLPQPNNDTLVQISLGSAQFSTLGNTNGQFDPNEQFVLTETIAVVGCDGHTNRQRRLTYGCDADVCEAFLLNSTLRLGEGTPQALIRQGQQTDAGYCQTGSVELVVLNNGQETDLGFGALLDVQVDFGLGSTFSAMDNGYFATNFNVQGLAFTPTNGRFSLRNHPLLVVDIDGAGGLEDVDNDGYYDDLPIGQQLVVFANYDFDCTLAQTDGPDDFCVNDFNSAFTTRLQYLDGCRTETTNLGFNFVRPTNGNTALDTDRTLDAFAERDTFFITHRQSRAIRDFENNCGNQGQFLVEVALPSGVTPVESAIRLTKNGFIPLPLLNSTLRNDTLILAFSASLAVLGGNYEVELAFTADCTAEMGPTAFPFSFSYYCPGCDCTHIWACQTLAGPRLHATNPPCPPEVAIQCPRGVQTQATSLDRTTFGFADANFSAPLPANERNTKAAISCDSVRWILEGRVGETPLSGNTQIVLAYENVLPVTNGEPIFNWGTGTFNWNSASGVQTCIIPQNAVTTVQNLGAQQLIVDLDACFAQTNWVIPSFDSVWIAADLALNPDGSYDNRFRDIQGLEGYWQYVGGGTNEICDIFSADFKVAKPRTLLNGPSNNSQPRGCEPVNLNYDLLTVNNGYEAVFGDEYRPIFKLDSFRLTFDPELLNRYSDLSVTMTYPGHPVHGNASFSVGNLADATNGVFSLDLSDLAPTATFNQVRSTDFGIQVRLLPNCATLAAGNNVGVAYSIVPEVFFEDRYYALLDNPDCVEPTVLSAPFSIRYSNPPSISFVPLTPTNSLLTSDEAFWEFELCNTTGISDVGMVWFTLEQLPNNLNSIQLERRDGANWLPLNVALNNSDAFALDDGLVGFNNTGDACRRYRLRASISDCQTKNLTISAGWQCAFDATFEPLNSNCDKQQIPLLISPRVATLQTELLDEPGTLSDLCTATSFEIVLRNVGRGKAVDLMGTIQLPGQGFEVDPNSFEIAYPASGTYLPLATSPTLTAANGGTVLNINSLDDLIQGWSARGLPGFAPNLPVDSTEFKLRFGATTNCDFVNGSQISYAFQGLTSCGDATNQTAGESLPVRIAGVDVVPDKELNIDLDSTGSLLNGDSLNLNWTITHLAGNPTTATDFFVIRIPADIQFDLADLRLSWLPVVQETVVNADGSTTLQMSLPNRMEAGDEATASWSIRGGAGICAQTSVTLEYYTGVLTDIACASSTIDCQIATITSGGSIQLLNLNINGTADFGTLSATSWCSDFDQETITLSGNWLPLDPNLTEVDIRYYLDRNDNGLIDGMDSLIASFTDVTPNYQHQLDVRVDWTCRLLTTFDTSTTTWCGAPPVLQVPTPVLQNGGLDVVFCADSPVVTQNIGINCPNSGYSFEWQAANAANLALLSSTDIASPVIDVSGLPAGAIQLEYYLLTTRPSCGGTTTDTVLVAVQEELIITPVYQDTIDFGGTSAINLMTSGGQLPFDYNWAPTAGLSNTNLPNVDASPTSSTVYTVIITDAVGCTASAVLPITVFRPVLATATPADTVLCTGDQLTIIASGGDRYQWEAASTNPATNTLSDTTIANPVFTPAAVGQYTFTVKVSFGVQPTVIDSATVVITVGAQANLTLTTVDTACQNAPFAVLSNSGIPIPNSVYTWSPAPLYGQGAPIAIYEPFGTTNINLTVTDTLSGCTSSADKTVFIEDCICTPPVVVQTDILGALCGASNGQIRATTDIPASQLTFEWQNADGQVIDNDSELSTVEAGIYQLRTNRTDDPDCFSLDYFVVPNLDGPVPDAIITNNASCALANGTVSLAPSTWNYTWTDGFVGAMRNDLTSGVYPLQVVNPSQPNCPNFILVTVEANSTLTVDHTVLNAPICGNSDGSVQLDVTGGSGNYAYDWLSPTNVQSGLAAGSYFVEITDTMSGCSANYGFVLTNNAATAVITPVDTSDVTCPGAADGRFEFDITYDNRFAFPADTIFRSFGDSTAVNGQLAGGIYCLEIRDANDCLADGFCFEIAEPEPLFLETTATTDCGNGGSITAVVSGGTAPYRFDWDHLASANDSSFVTNLVFGESYALTVTDAEGCSQIASDLTVNDCPGCDYFEQDTSYVQALNCTDSIAFCLNTGALTANSLEISINGVLSGAPLTTCTFDTSGIYGIAGIMDGVDYELTGWLVNGQLLTGTFNSRQGLVDLLLGLDPNGNWQLSADGQSISGGVNGTTYGSLELRVIASGNVSVLPFSPQFSPSSRGILLPTGWSTVIAFNPILNCADTTAVLVACSTSDTAAVVVEVGATDTLCFSTDELVGMTFSGSVISGNTTEYDLEWLADSCFLLTGNIVGNGTSTVVLCDEFGICDTTFLNVTVINSFADNSVFDTVVVSEIKTLCANDLALDIDLSLGLASFVNICPDDSGTNVEFSVIGSGPCFQYEGLTIGTDTACWQICNTLGECDTVNMIVTTIPGEWISDTVVINQDTVTYCVDVDQLGGDIVSIENGCPDSSDGDVNFNYDPLTNCLTYFGVNIGTDTLCLRLEDRSGAVGWWTFQITSIATRNDRVCDDIFVAETVVFCLDTTELQGTVVSVTEVCADQTIGNVEFFNLAPTVCIEYTGLAIGFDTTCFVVCDDLGICDTTSFCITVEEYFDPPIANPDTVNTFKESPVVIPIKRNDIIFGGIDTAYILTPPNDGTATVNGDCSVSYLPNDGICERWDGFEYVICNPIGCDTTNVAIFINCIDIEVFTAVSPNGDGSNDEFFIAKILDFPENRLRIYNRWGNLVYEKEGYANEWPGTWNDDKILPDGTYFYLLEVEDQGRTEIFRGYLELFR